MKTEKHLIRVGDSAPPVIEWDTESNAFYIRFKKGKVAQTLDRQAKSFHLAVDLDERGELLGIEAIGVNSFTISRILKDARVEAPGIDFSKAEFKSTSLVST